MRRSQAQNAVNDCFGVIPNTFIACGEGGNYCSQRCFEAGERK